MEATETENREVGAGTTIKSPQKRNKRKWKRVEVRYLFPADYTIFADGKCVAIVYFKPNAQKPVVQVWRDNVEDVEIRTTETTNKKIEGGS